MKVKQAEIFTVDPFTAQLVAKNISCKGAQDGAIAVLVSGTATLPSSTNFFPLQLSLIIGGTGQQSFQWKFPNVTLSSSQNISNLGPGLYNVTITDANLCSSSLVVQISEPGKFVH